MSKTFTNAEVAQRDGKDGRELWTSIDGTVYNLTKFQRLHPGGKVILQQFGGKDTSEQFWLYHNKHIMRKYHDKLKIGTLSDYTERSVMEIPGSFGDCVPYGDPMWYTAFNSPYYKETHRKFRARVRRFVEEEIMPTLPQWKDGPEPPREIYAKMGKEGFLACMGGPPFPRDYVDPGTPEPEDFDYFHELILYDELNRVGHSAAVAALSNGPSIALTAVMAFGTPEQKRKFAPDCLMGRKFVALAVSEAGAGSDVAGLGCRAVRQGDHYVVTGHKKWITNGMYADFYVTAVLTGQPGQKGLSFLVIERDLEGFTTRKIGIRGSDVSGTAYLNFDNVKVDAANLIGVENKGWKCIMSNFAHERFYVAICTARMARVCLEESIKFAMRRKTFGKYLYQHQDIRMRIAYMASRVESLQALIDNVAFQMNTMSKEEANLKLGDYMCMVKALGSQVYEYCARETTMIFGGNALMMSGAGEKIEPSVAQVKGYQVPAGSENTMFDYAARAAFRKAKMFAKF